MRSVSSIIAGSTALLTALCIVMWWIFGYIVFPAVWQIAILTWLGAIWLELRSRW